MFTLLFRSKGACADQDLTWATVSDVPDIVGMFLGSLKTQYARLSPIEYMQAATKFLVANAKGSAQ